MFKVNNKDTRTTPHLVLVFLLLTLSRYIPAGRKTPAFESLINNIADLQP